MVPVNSFSDLKGLHLVCATVRRDGDSDEVRFEVADGRAFLLWHEQDCCESVYIEDVDGIDAGGRLVDLVGEVVVAEESSNSRDDSDGSQTWTFYRIATARGLVVIRWHGSSNGYYSESVSFAEVSA